MQIQVIKYFLTLVLEWMSFNSRQFISTPLLTYIQALLSLVVLLHFCALIGRELHSVASPALLCH